jgi:hypothetical protein
MAWLCTIKCRGELTLARDIYHCISMKERGFIVVAISGSIPTDKSVGIAQDCIPTDKSVGIAQGCARDIRIMPAVHNKYSIKS